MDYQETARLRQIALENRRLVRSHVDLDFAAAADIEVLESVNEDFNRLNIQLDGLHRDMLQS
jgi:hypothetical protein